MDDEWKDWGILSSLQKIAPPRFMWRQGSHEMEERSARIRAQYNEVVEELEDEGYGRLVTMKDRLCSHLSEVQDRVHKWRGRVLHSQLQHKAYFQLLLELVTKRVGNDAELEKIEKACNSLRDRQIGKVWFNDGAVPFEPKSNWNVALSGAADTPQSLSDVTVRYTTTEKALPRYGLHQKYDGYDSESFQGGLTHSFTGDTPWGEVFESLEKQRDANVERKNRATRTAKLLRFRISVIETVLYRYEAFGTVTQMTEDEALKTVTQKPSYITNPPDDLFKGRGTKDRTKAKHYARELAEIFVGDEKIPDQWTPLHGMMNGKTGGRNKVQCIRRAFKAHPQTGEPKNPESLAQACYHFFDEVTFN